MTSAAQVARRFLVANDFPTEEALRKYLKEHPDANRAKHTVQKNDSKPGQSESTGQKPKPKQPPPIPEAAKKSAPPQAKTTPPSEGAKSGPSEKAPKAPSAKVEPGKTEAPGKGESSGKTDTEVPGKPKEGWTSRFKNLSEKATKVIKEAPKAFRHFLGDDDFRREALNQAKEKLTKGSKKLVSNLVETAKHEVKEFKTAVGGVKNVMAGKPMTKKQKHAFKAVASHMALAGAAAALTAASPLGGVGLFSKSLVTKIAAKAVSRATDKAHTLVEWGEIGHGVHHLLQHIASDGKKKTMDAEEAMTKLILASVAKEIDDLTDEDFQEALESMGSEKTARDRVVSRFNGLS